MGKVFTSVGELLNAMDTLLNIMDDPELDTVVTPKVYAKVAEAMKNAMLREAVHRGTRYVLKEDGAIETSPAPEPFRDLMDINVHVGEYDDEEDMISPEDQERLVNLAIDLKVDTEKLRTLLDIHHDRTNNGGIAELIEIAAEGDTADWVEDQIRAAAAE